MGEVRGCLMRMRVWLSLDLDKMEMVGIYR